MTETPPRGTLGPGAELDGFVIEEVAGRGGMGVVYRARQSRPDRVVALKVISAEFAQDRAFRVRFQRESSIAAQIEHPNVIPVYAVGEAGGVLYIVMRFVDGTDLRRMLAQEGRLQPDRAAAIVDAVGQALDAAHAYGLVHRDVKPANILISPVGGRDHVYLSDFGLSRHIEGSGVTTTGGFLGTIDYVAPEQARGERVDARADVYSLGCVLFQALTGTVPFPLDNDIAKLYAHDRRPPPSALERASDLPREFEMVLARAMAKVPDERYLSAGDLGRAALAAASGSSLSRAERSVAVGGAAPEDTRPVQAPAPTEAVPTSPTVQSPAAPDTAPAAPRAAPSSADVPPAAPATTAPSSAGAPPAAPATTAPSSADAPRAAPAKTAPPQRLAARGRGLVLSAVALLLAAGLAFVLLGGRDDKPGAGSTQSSAAEPGAGGGGAAVIAATNLTSNPSFENDTSRWGGFNSEIERVSATDAPDGDHVAQVRLTSSEGDYSIDDIGDTVSSSVKGRTYSATAWVKGTASSDGKPVCIALRERRSDDTSAGYADASVTASAGEYRPVRVSHVANEDGNRIDVHVTMAGASEGEAFLIDAITLTESSADASPPCP